MLENAFNALKTYDWGSEPGQLQEIRDAVVTVIIEVVWNLVFRDKKKA